MILSLNEKYDVTPEWFEAQVRNALEVGSPEVVEKLTLPRLCELLSVYKVKDAAGTQEAARRMKGLLDSPVIDVAME